MLDYIIKFFNERNYSYKLNFIQDTIDDNSFDEWFKKQKIYSNKKDLKPHDYQLDAVKQALNKQRILLLSPTGSGKSLIIYLILQFVYPQNYL